MRLRHIFLLLLAALAPLSAAERPLLERGPEIVRGENDADWQPLFSALAEKGAVFSRIEEHRWFRVRKKPAVLTAEMRLSPEHGLSLDYGARTVIVDDRGMLLRDGRGRSRVVKADDRGPAVNTWLLPVLRFDLAALEQTFRLHGNRDGAAWRLDFVPRDTMDENDVGSIMVHGANDAITRIELHPKPDVRVEILIGETQTDVSFSPEDVRRFFR